MNEPKEIFLKDLMSRYENCQPQDMKVRDKFALIDENDVSSNLRKF